MKKKSEFKVGNIFEQNIEKAFLKLWWSLIPQVRTNNDAHENNESAPIPNKIRTNYEMLFQIIARMWLCNIGIKSNSHINRKPGLNYDLSYFYYHLF